MWLGLRHIGLYILFVIFFTACVGGIDGGVSTPKKKSVLDFNEFDNPVENKSDTADVGVGLSGEDLMTPEQKQKYASLQKKKEQLESLIEGVDRDRMAIQIERMQPVGHFGRGMVSNNAETTVMDGKVINRETGERQVLDLNIEKLKRLDWQEEELTNEIKVLRKELSVVESEIDRLKNEAQKSCFSADTLILLANGKTKEIFKIKKDDKVMVYDIAKNQIGTGIVNKLFISSNNHMYIINNTIKATAYERFLSKNKGWIKIRDLRVGDKIFDGNSFQKITSIQKIKKNQKVYNLNIAQKHNFFASNNGEEFFLIHNSSGGHGGSSSGGGK